VGSIVVAQNVTTISDQTYTAKTITLGGSTTNQTLALSSIQSDGDIIFNTGATTNSGGVSQASPSARVAVYINGGAVSGLSSNVNYTTYNSAPSNDSSSNSGYTGNLSGAIQNSLNMAFFKTASESIFDQNLEDVEVGEVEVGSQD
jgi:hypothetical protein